MKILIADDDSISGRVLKKILHKWGEADIVADGLEAVIKFKTARESGEPYDLICLDINMPMLDGLKALNIIRETERGDEKPVTVFITTSHSSAENVLAAKKKGQCAAFLVKPIERELVEKALANAELLSEEKG